MSTSIEKLKSSVKRSIVDVKDRHDVQDRLTVGNYVTSGSNLFFEDETVKVNGKLIEIRRLYCQTDPLGFEGVGWVINDDVNRCMICSIEFGMMRYKHHCRSCGNIVCHSCSPDTVEIHEIAELGKQRVCKQCYWGQYPVYVTHKSEGIYNNDDGYESLANLADSGENFTLYTPVSKSAASKLFSRVEQENTEIVKGNEGWGSLDLISLEESLNMKRLSDLSKDDTIEQLEKEKGKLQVEKDIMLRNHEEEKERLQREIEEQLRQQHQREKELWQLELEKEKEKLKQDLENERLERARLQKEQEAKESKELLEIQRLEKEREEEKLKAETERLELMKLIEEQKSREEEANKIRLKNLAEEEEADQKRKHAEKEMQEHTLRIEEEKKRIIEEETIKAERLMQEHTKRMEEEQQKALEQEKIRAEQERLELLKQIEEEQQKALEQEKIRAEQERLELLKRIEEEQQKALEQEKIRAEQERLELLKQAEEERQKALEQERIRAEQERLELLKQAEEERQKALEQERIRAEQERLELLQRIEEEQQNAMEQEKIRAARKEEEKKLMDIERRFSQKGKRKSILAAIVDHEEKLDEAKEKEKIRTKSGELQETDKARLLEQSRALENEENERIKNSIAIYEEQEKERVRKAATDLEIAEMERIRVATGELEAREKRRVRLASMAMEEEEKEKLMKEAFYLEEKEREKLRLEALSLEESEKERIRLASVALEVSEKERIKQAAIAMEETEKERVRLAAIAIEEAEKERLRLALLAIEEEEKKRLKIMIQGENSKLEALQSQNRLNASRDKTRLKSVVISTKQLQMEQAAEKAAKGRSELESALQQRRKKQSELMEKEAEEDARRKREHDLLLETALSDIEQKRDHRRGSVIQGSIKNENHISNEISSSTIIDDGPTSLETSTPSQADIIARETAPEIASTPQATTPISSVSSPIPPPPPPPLSSLPISFVESNSEKVVHDGSAPEVGVKEDGSSTSRNNSESSSSIQPLAGIVLKTADKGTDVKVFINITHHGGITYDANALIRHGNDCMSLVYVCEVDETLDQSGTVSFVVDVIIYTDYYNASNENQNQLCSIIIDNVRNSTGLDLDYDFKLPRIVGNYKNSSKNTCPPLVALPLTITSSGIRKSSNIKSIASRSSRSRKSEEIINFATASEQREWSSLAEEGETIIAVGLIGKKNPIGLTHKRQLILTLQNSGGRIFPRLFYVDPVTKAVKGEITFVNIKEYNSKQTKTIASVTDIQNQMFEIETIDRIYAFKDLSSGASKKGATWWTNVINDVAKKYL